MTLDPLTLVGLIAIVTLAAVINGAIGFGFALLAVNALALVLGAKDGVLVMSLIAPVVSGLQLLRHRRYAPVWRRLLSLVVAGIIGSLIGAQLLVILPAAVVSIALGAFTVWYVVGALRGDRPPLAHSTERRIAPAIGLVGGISNGTLGASGPVFGSYLTAIGLRGREFAFAISLSFFSMALPRIALFAVVGQYTPALVLGAVALYLPAIAAQRAGFYFQNRIDPRTLHRAVLVVLFIASVNLLWRGAQGLLESWPFG